MTDLETAAREEVWAIIPGFENYQISSLGRIMSFNGRHNKSKGIILRQGENRFGYKHIGLYSGKKRKLIRVNRLVLLAFIGDCPEGYQGAHLNGIKTDNRLVNLKWVTRQENADHKVSHGTLPYGDKHRRSKIKSKWLPDILLRLKNGQSCASIARKYKVNRNTISHIKLKKTWQKALSEVQKLRGAGSI